MMLAKNQIKRILKQCERVNEAIEDDIDLSKLTKLQNAWARNIGWIQALNLVLEQDTYPIRKDVLDD